MSKFGTDNSLLTDERDSDTRQLLVIIKHLNVSNLIIINLHGNDSRKMDNPEYTFIDVVESIWSGNTLFLLLKGVKC